MKAAYIMAIVLLVITGLVIPGVFAIKDDEEFNKTAKEGVDKTIDVKNQLNNLVARGDKFAAITKAGNLRMNGQFYEMQLDRFETSESIAEFADDLYNYFHGMYLYGYWYQKYLNQVDSYTAVSMDDERKFLENARKSFDIAHTYLNKTYPQAEPTPAKLDVSSFSYGLDSFMMGHSATL